MPSKEDDDESRLFGIRDLGNECRCCNGDLPAGFGVVGIVMAPAEESGGEIVICCRILRIAWADADCGWEWR